jgi:hypothetical protein
MKPTIGKGANSNNINEEKKPTAVRNFIEINTHHNITEKREYVYLEDVKEAVNINTLEERIILKRWLIKQLQASKSTSLLIQVLFDSSDKDRHRLIKEYKISL